MGRAVALFSPLKNFGWTLNFAWRHGRHPRRRVGEGRVMPLNDTMVRLLSAGGRSFASEPLPGTPLPGLHPEVIQDLESSYPGVLSPDMRRLLRISCGLAGTLLGDIDFTGRWYTEEPLAV